MKNFFYLFLIIGITLVSISSCTNRMSVFSKALYEENNWTDNELQNIQFFLSEDIVLRRSYKKGEAVISSGKIKVINGKKIEEVLFEKGTPGVFIHRKKENHFAVSFEAGERYLVFGPNNSTNGSYALLAMGWKGRKGTITYDDKRWKTYNNGHVAKLLIDLKKINNISVKKRRVGGRKIGS